MLRWGTRGGWLIVIALGAFAPPAALAMPGDLDPTFSGDGKLTTPLAPGGGHAAALTVQSDGKIVAAGEARPGPGINDDFAVVRYRPDGSLDPSFSGDGKVTFSFGSDQDGASAVAMQADGKIVVAGSTEVPGGREFAVARLTANGALDPSFSGDGKLTTSFAAGGFEPANAIAVQADGKVVVAGYSNTVPTGYRFALARYTRNGTLDPSFSGDGKQLTDFFPAYNGVDGATGLVLQRDGKLVAGGTARGPAGNYFALARYNPNGSLDTSFSGDGEQLISVVPGFGGGANALALLPNGQLVLAGSTVRAGQSDTALVRVNANGSLDPSFSGDGRVVVSFSSAVDVAYGLAAQADGKVVVTGRADPGVFVARFNANGTVDPTFRSRRADFTDLNAAAVQSDGRLLAAGGVAGQFALARYQGDRANLSLAAAGGAPKRKGTTTISLNVFNSGPQGAFATAFATLPPGLTFVSGPGCWAAGQFVTCGTALIGAGRTGIVPITVRAAGKARGPLTTLAGVSGPTFDPDRSGNVATLQTYLRGRCLNRTTKGTKGKDRLKGTRYGDSLSGGRGNDRLTGGKGDDCLSGGSGNDSLKGGSGKDKLSGGSGKDKLSGGSGKDRLDGGAGNDRITGGPGKDKVKGGSGNDRINVRGGGRDSVNCGRGRDSVKADRKDRLKGCEKIRRR